MTESPQRLKRGWRNWITQFALLVLLGLHSAGLFHHHATAQEHDDCVACQVSDHQVLDVPDAGLGLASSLLVLLFLVPTRHPGSPRCSKLFRRARSRAPPALLTL